MSALNEKTRRSGVQGSDSLIGGLIYFIVASSPNAQEQHDLVALDLIDDANITYPDPTMTGQSTAKGLADLVWFSFNDPFPDHLKDEGVRIFV